MTILSPALSAIVEDTRGFTVSNTNVPSVTFQPLVIPSATAPVAVSPQYHYPSLLLDEATILDHPPLLPPPSSLTDNIPLMSPPQSMKGLISKTLLKGILGNGGNATGQRGLLHPKILLSMMTYTPLATSVTAGPGRVGCRLGGLRL
jgi:hypothetical protein